MSEITTIRFDGDNLQAVRDGDQVWVVVKRVCDALGVDHSGQVAKLKTQPWATMEKFSMVAEDGKTREMLCIDQRRLAMWLATIEANKASPEAREKLTAYQCKCAEVLHWHFFGGRDQASSPELSVIAAGVSALATQVDHIARQVAWLTQHIALGGIIAPAQLRHLRSEVKSIAALEVASGRFKNPRASSADLYREMGAMTGWGGKGKPWTELPAQMAPVAMAVLRVRRTDAQKIVCSPTRQLRLVGVGSAASLA